MPPRGAGLLLGVGLDALLGDPQRHHPVAWFGRWAGAVEQRIWADSRGRGVVSWLAVVAPVAVGGVAVERATRTRPLARALSTAVATWAVLGARSLASEGHAMADHLERGDLDAARQRLSHLCGRRPDGLDEAELSRATVESIAENAADAVVAPLFWGAVAGVPGLLVHRAANTLDAMVGHHNPRYERFGWCAARLDDLACLPASRITAGLATLAAPVVGGSVGRTARIVAHDHARHPSPNGGWCESAWAGALGVRLGGRNVYPGGRVEERGLLGDGPAPTAATARRAARLLGVVTGAAAALAAIGALR